MGSNRNIRIVLQVLEVVLDAAHDGDVARIFEAAVSYDTEVGVNLRRLRRQIGAEP